MLNTIVTQTRLTQKRHTMKLRRCAETRQNHQAHPADFAGDSLIEHDPLAPGSWVVAGVAGR